jgi:hypothetical protein
MIRLVQLRHPARARRVALVDGGKLRLLRSHRSVYDLAMAAIGQKVRLAELIKRDTSDDALDYGPIYDAEDPDGWRLLPAADHPTEPARCLVTGTGLTHKVSAQNRNAMHEKAQAAAGGPPKVTDSMLMFRWGMEGGKPAAGAVGVVPEWFFKGRGHILRAHGEPLTVPPYAGDGGEEAELAGVYVIAPDGSPRRIGMTVANEFSDHVTESKNYLYLAPSKLRDCALGPELVIDPDYADVRGASRVERGGKAVWSGTVMTGEANMTHSVANLEHHHFKYAAHRVPGDVHVHVFGADAFSFGDKVALQDGDEMVIEFPGFGRALRNPLRVEGGAEKFVQAQPL